MSRDELQRGVSRAVFEARAALAAFGRAARLACGAGDYASYLAHQRQVHPGAPVLSERAFFESRQAARYGAGGLRCC